MPGSNPLLPGVVPARRRTAFEVTCYLSLPSIFYKRRNVASAKFDDSVFKALGQSRPSLSETLTQKGEDNERFASILELVLALGLEGQSRPSLIGALTKKEWQHELA